MISYTKTIAKFKSKKFGENEKLKFLIETKNTMYFE